MTWRWRVRSWLSRGRVDRDLEDEFRSHLQMRARELEEAGMSEVDARLEARRKFGNPTSIREQTREGHPGHPFETFWQDTRYACRVLGRERGFAIAAIVTLALAIGANGAVFSLIDAALLRPAAYPLPEQLVFLWGRDGQHKKTLISAADLDDWRQAESFTAISSLMGQSVNLTGIEQPARIEGAFVSAEYFRILGVNAAIGRTFNDAEGRPGAERVAIISYGLWQDRFGGDPKLPGHKLILNGEAFTLIGILPREFSPPFFAPDVWLPPQFYPGYTGNRAQRSVVAIGRLSAGATAEQASVELNRIAGQLARAYSDTNRDRGATLVGFHQLMVEEVRPILIALAAALGCLLVIACANIANLLLSKAAGRRHEMAVRAALGAGRMRLVRQLLTESLVLSAIGTVLGVGVAYGLSKYIPAELSAWPEGVRVHMNANVLGFMAITAVTTAVLFGLAPALTARRAAEQGLRVRGGSEGAPLGSALAIGQVAMALVMLTGAGLMIESMRHLLHVNTGFDGSRVLSMEYRLPQNKYSEGVQQGRFHEEVVRRVQALPGVEAAGIVRGLPFSGNGGMVEIGLPDGPNAPHNSPYTALYNAATRTYFETVRIPLLAGRSFTASDNWHAARVAVVSESFVRRYWPSRDALGRQVLIPSSDPAVAPGKVPLAAATVVGVVGNVRHDRLDEPDTPQLYVPYAQDPITFATLVVRTTGNPMSRVHDVQRAVWSIDKDQPIWKIRTLASLVEASVGPRRFLLNMLSWFAGLGLLLATVGLYAVISYQTTQRTAELGIRMALGASPGRIVAMVLRKGLILAVAGATAGSALAPVLARALRAQLYGVREYDLTVYAMLAVLLVGIGAAAVLAPAIRAARTDPMQALRAE